MPLQSDVITETNRRTEEHKNERDLMRKKKRAVMDTKNKATKALEQCKLNMAEIEDKKAQADLFVQELRARGDDNDAVAKELEQWQEKKSSMADSLEQSQQVLMDERNSYSHVMVCSL